MMRALWLGPLIGAAMAAGAVLAGAIQSPTALRPGLAAGVTATARETGLSGSAFAIAPGVLVTNSHVIQGCHRLGVAIRVRAMSGPWRVLAENADADLALIGGPVADDATLPLSSALQLPRGTPVMALGYAGGQATHATLAAGRVLRAALTIHEPAVGQGLSFVLEDRQGREVAPTWDDGLRYFGAPQADRLRWMLEVDAAVAPGASGGPVVDGSGNVVGVIFAGDARRQLTAVVPLDDLRELLRRVDVLPRFGLRHLAPDPDWAEVGSRVTRAVHQILC